jgi:hypothetical protein
MAGAPQVVAIVYVQMSWMFHDYLLISAVAGASSVLAKTYSVLEPQTVGFIPHWVIAISGLVHPFDSAKEPTKALAVKIAESTQELSVIAP